MDSVNFLWSGISERVICLFPPCPLSFQLLRAELLPAYFKVKHAPSPVSVNVTLSTLQVW